MLDTNHIANTLRNTLSKNPEKVERFRIGANFEVDFLQFTDRPYLGANSIITNGVSDYFSKKAIEFILIYDPNSLENGTDLNAFMATYLQLHFLNNIDSIKIGDYFKVPGALIQGYDFVGIYTTSPCYFSDDIFSPLPEIKFLWLIPIFQNEYEFIDKFGADEFESYIVKYDPDLSRYDRLPMVLSE